MITDITHRCLNASLAACFLAEMGYPNINRASYDLLRVEATTLLRDAIPVEVALPDTPAEMQAEQGELVRAIAQSLAELRMRIDGDVLSVTFFMLSFTACRGVLWVAFGEGALWAPHRRILMACMSEVGLDPSEEIERFEVMARGLVISVNDSPHLRDADRIDGSLGFLKETFRRVQDRWLLPAGLTDQLAALTRSVEELRRENRADHDQILGSLADLRSDLVKRLVEEGVAPMQATAIADVESPTFMARLRRWAATEQARDAAEAALWAALDFVPGGTGVKLGIKVLGAVRKSLSG